MQKHMDTTLTRLERGLGAWEKAGRGWALNLQSWALDSELSARCEEQTVLKQINQDLLGLGPSVFICWAPDVRTSGFTRFPEASPSLQVRQGNPGRSTSANYVYDKPS